MEQDEVSNDELYFLKFHVIGGDILCVEVTAVGKRYHSGNAILSLWIWIEFNKSNTCVTHIKMGTECRIGNIKKTGKEQERHKHTGEPDVNICLGVIHTELDAGQVCDSQELLETQACSHTSHWAQTCLSYPAGNLLNLPLSWDMSVKHRDS